MGSRAIVNGGQMLQAYEPGRAAAYGDGLFETIAVIAGKPLWLDAHLQRLRLDASRLGMDVDFALIGAELSTLLAASSEDGIVKIIVSRRAGGRGYAPSQRETERSLQWFPGAIGNRQNWESGVKLMLCQQRLAAQPVLAGIKHLNRLEQVLAAAEVTARGVTEGLMLDYSGRLIEGTRSNVFLVIDGKLLTPRLVTSGVAGIMRQKIFDAALTLGLSCRECELGLEDVYRADEILVCNSVFGIWPVTALDCVTKSIGPVSRSLQEYFDADFYA